MSQLQTALQDHVKDGSTLSFHHHLRNGDDVMRQVLQVCSDMGLRDLHIAPSSLFPCHASLIPFLENGTVTRITTSYMNGPLADTIKAGVLPHPVRLQTHGGRAAAIEGERLKIDLAVIAAPAVDAEGNLTGAVGQNACGPLGYAMVDAAHAKHVVAVTDALPTVLPRICIPATQIDHIVTVDSIGNAGQIASGTTARDPGQEGRKVADMTARLIDVARLNTSGFSYQAGAGAISMAVSRALGPMMHARGIVGDFACGGITEPLVDMHRAGLFRELQDVQAFDQAAVESYAIDPGHKGISASDYASPAREDALANRLSIVVLGASEVDHEFNVNVTTTSDGKIIGGSGGHSDVAEGARFTIIATRSMSRLGPKLVRRVQHCTTPGRFVDAVVTEHGVVTNGAKWSYLTRRLRDAGLPTMSRHRLIGEFGSSNATLPKEGRVIAETEDRHGTVIDTIRAD